MKIVLIAGTALLLAVFAQGTVIVKWGDLSNGDTGIVAVNQNGTSVPTTYSTNTVANPTVGTNYYSVSTGRNPAFYAALSVSGKSVQVADQGANNGDVISLVSSAAAGTHVQGMVVWARQGDAGGNYGFLTGTSGVAITNLSILACSRQVNGIGDGHWLIEKGGQFYSSAETFAYSGSTYLTTVVAASNLTWKVFNAFTNGVASSGAATNITLTEVTSVGVYFDTLNNEATLSKSTGLGIRGIVVEGDTGRLQLAVHPLFYDNMVLQRNMDVPVWGNAEPGAVVTVKLDGATVGTATADSAGKWLAHIGMHANDGGLPHVLLISSPGDGDIQFNNVVFGDVYLASGQSNMLLAMSAIGDFYTNELSIADDYSLIRQVAITRAESTVPVDEPALDAVWVKCSRTSLGGFTAVGYYFAKEIFLHTGVPIGLIRSAYGGQMIERFLSPSGMAEAPELAGLLENQEAGGLTNYSDLYNGMIAPLVPYGLRGIIWYQGEANANGGGSSYRLKMLALMRGWRKEWGLGDVPFYFVQLANLDTIQDWPRLRQAQMEALSETNSGMAVTIDIGNDLNIHPINKIDVGSRLAQWALAKDYQYNVVYSGPLFHETLVEGASIRVVFDLAEDGLMTGPKNGTNPVVQVSGPLENFEIAGANKLFTNAVAVIDQNTVVVSNSVITMPVYVRYCYVGAPAGSNKLYNAAGLPASPFRTDELEYRVEVVSGTAGGAANHYAGSVFSLVADSPAAGKVFDRWIGAASEINNLNASTATVTMPPHSLYLLATYRAASEPVYTNTVNNGFGSGTSKAGSILNIEANAAASGQVFDHWAGDTQGVAHVSAATTTLRMPTNNVTVTAVYRTVDSVGDGIPDVWRAMYFGGDGSLTNSQSAAMADPDGDGLTNWQEAQAGTSPTNALSVLRLNGVVTPGGLMFSFQSVAGHRYQLETAENLVSPAWIPVLYNILGNGGQKSAKFNTGSASKGFFRLYLVIE